jgi:hypothetical protein
VSRSEDVHGPIHRSVYEQAGRKESGENLRYGHDPKPHFAAGEASRSANENGATLVGDKQSGRFSHDMISGEYRMVGQKVIVTIIEKHWLVAWPAVESQLRKLLL